MILDILLCFSFQVNENGTLMNTLLHIKLLKIYVQAKTEMGKIVSDATGKASCHTAGKD